MCAVLVSAISVHAREPMRAAWFPDSSNVTRFAWSSELCEGCTPAVPRDEWKRMAALSGLGSIHFLLSGDETHGPAWSYAPGTVVLSPSALKLPQCQLAFVVGHELVHIAQRHFDEDAHDVSVLSGMPATWTGKGEAAMELLDGDFPLAMRMTAIWHQQEREADWVGALLAAQACGCSMEEGALSYLGVDTRSGGGVISAHDEGAERVRFLQAFIESAHRLTRRQP
jgi:hypothetical protein